MCKICDSGLIAGDKVTFVDIDSGNCNGCKSPFVLHSIKAIYNGASKTTSFIGHNFIFDERWVCESCKRSGIDIDLPCDKYILDMSGKLLLKFNHTTISDKLNSLLSNIDYFK